MNSIKFQVKHGIATGISFLKPVADNLPSHRCLMYHSLENPFYDSGDLYSLPVDQFKQQIEWLKENGFRFRPFGSNDPVRNATEISVTFDDGFLDNYTEAMPFLVSQGVPFTVFMISDFIGAEYKNYLNVHELREMVKNPLVTIGGHGKSHSNLLHLSHEAAVAELTESKKTLEDVLGKEVTTMSFPHGGFNEGLVEAAANLGFKKCGTSVALPNFSAGTVKVNRQAIFFCDGSISFKQKVKGQWDWTATL
ncbi:MAG: polysaccharide deacetylase family protein [Bdellovibrionota bacterium]